MEKKYCRGRLDSEVRGKQQHQCGSYNHIKFGSACIYVMEAYDLQKKVTFEFC